MTMIGELFDTHVVVDEPEADCLPVLGLEAMEFLRSLYDDAELVGMINARDVTRTWSKLTALVQIGVERDYVAISWTPGLNSPTIYEATCAWQKRETGWRQYTYEPEGYGTRGPDELFVWGDVVDVHRVNGYTVVESLDHLASNAEPGAERRTNFHVGRVDGHRIGHSWRSLDMALLHCMACRAALSGVNGRARASNNSGDVMFAARGLRMQGSW